MRVIPSSATQRTINIYRKLNRMNKSEITGLNVTDFAAQFDVCYITVYNAVRNYRALNLLF